MLGVGCSNHWAEFKAAPEVTPRELVRVRWHLKISRALFAVYLRTNVRTLENWGAGAGEAECAGGVADQPGEALPGHGRKTCRHLSGGIRDRLDCQGRQSRPASLASRMAACHAGFPCGRFCTAMWARLGFFLRSITWNDNGRRCRWLIRRTIPLPARVS
jgi:hypothetical protein